MTAPLRMESLQIAALLSELNDESRTPDEMNAYEQLGCVVRQVKPT